MRDLTTAKGSRHAPLWVGCGAAALGLLVQSCGSDDDEALALTEEGWC